jgi:ABC-type nitrate/sulfonate/bicarbonate transport system ATPase subunit
MKDKTVVPRLSLEHVTHGYGDVRVVHNLSFTVKAGEIVVLVGPSGCGKTTILNLLSGYLKPQSGSVTREGVVRTVYQKDGLFPWLTVVENISLGLRSVQDDAWRNNELKELVR